MSYTDLLSPLSESDYRALRDDIAERGCVVPILVDAEGATIDGANRKRACEELGMPLPSTALVNLTEREKRQLAIALNVHRRQLTRKQRRELVAKLVKAEPRKSDVQVAAKAGVTDKTVAAVRKGLESTSEIPRLDKREGADGKVRKQPVQKQPEPAPALRGPESEPEPEPALGPESVLEHDPDLHICPNCGHTFTTQGGQ